MTLVGGIDGAKYVELDAMAAQMTPALHDEIEGALSAAVSPVGVMKLAWPIYAQPDQEIVLLEEGAPCVVEQQAIGLERLLNHLPGPSVLFDQRDRVLEEFELHQRGLATLPSDSHLRGTMGFQELSDIGVERLLRHT